MTHVFPAPRHLHGIRRKRLRHDVQKLAEALIPLVRDHGRLDTVGDDKLILTYTMAAISVIEQHTGIAICDQAHEWGSSKGLPQGVLQIYPGPIREVTLKIAGAASAPAELIDAGSALNPYAIIEITEASTEAASIIFEGGSSNPFDMAPPILQAVLVTASHFYENREFSAPGASGRIPFMAEALLEPYRNIVLGV
jgi:uncharacterized phiE125 gp8 family phage protein